MMHEKSKVQPYIKVPQALLGRISYESAILYGALGYFLNDGLDLPQTTVSNQVIAERMGCTDRTVRRLLSQIPSDILHKEHEKIYQKDVTGFEYSFIQKRTISEVLGLKPDEVKHNLFIPLSLVRKKLPAGAKLLYGLTRNLAKNPFPLETTYLANLMKVDGRGAQRVLRWLRSLEKHGFIELKTQGNGYQIQHFGLQNGIGGGHK